MGFWLGGQEFLVAGFVIDPGMHRWVSAGALVGSAAVVPGLDVAQHGSFGLTMGREARVVVELGFEMREPLPSLTVC